MKKLLIALLLFPIMIMAQSDLSKAEKLFADKKFSLAIPYFEKALAKDKTDEIILERIGDCYGQLKNWDSALTYYRKLKTQKPNNANYWYKYGGVLGMKAKESNRFVALGMIGEIKRSFEHSIDLDSKHIDSRWALVELYLLLPGIVGGSETKAERYANELMQLSEVDGYLAKARISEYFGRYKLSERQYLTAHQIGNSEVTFQKLHLFYLKKLKDKSKAEKLQAQFSKSNS